MQDNVVKSFKVAMRIAYNGGGFYGFQSQNDVLSISNVLKEVFCSVGIFDSFIGSGRTDKGVHASAQVISLRIPYYWQDLESLKLRINKKLAPNIKIKQIWRVSDNFNARFTAKRRGYCYILSKIESPFLSPFTLHYQIQKPEILKTALCMLEGRHDFKAFSKQNGKEESSSQRIIYHTKLIQYKHFWIFSFWGNGFLRSQVRMMVGFLLEIDKGNLHLEDLQAQLKGEMRYRIPISPNGLFLTRVDY